MATFRNHLCAVVGDHKTEIYERFNVESLSVFGSVARGTDTHDSDVDILVKYKKTPGLFAFIEFNRYLDNIVGRKVDLVTEGALKYQFRKQIREDAIRVA